MVEATLEDVKVTKNFDENIQYLNQELAVKDNFDVACRELKFGGKKMYFYFVDGLIKDTVYLDITRTLSQLERDELVPNTFSKLIDTYISYVQVGDSNNMKEVIIGVLSGKMAIVIEGEDRIILVEARSYPARQPEEPDLEKVVRGSRDGFVETIILNTALIRRRIRDPKLRTIMVQAGARSQSDICIVYIEDIANPEMVNTIKQKIEDIKVDGLPMAEKSVEEYITGSRWNPFPKVRYTERPDVAAVHLLEGHILVMVDTSPSIMITPTTFAHHIQHAEEYRQNPAVGAYIRWVRFVAIAASFIILPLWLAASLQPEILPDWLKFIGPAKIGKVPLVLQVLIAEFGFDMVRIAAIHTPTPLSTALGIIAAFMIGQVAIDVGLFAPEIILYMAIAAVGTFATPSYELSMAMRIFRLFLIVLVGVFKIWGFIIGIIAMVVYLASIKSFGIPYLWPLIPFNGKALKDILIRAPIPIKNMRPSILKPLDPYRSPVASPSRKPLEEKGEEKGQDKKKNVIEVSKEGDISKKWDAKEKNKNKR